MGLCNLYPFECVKVDCNEQKVMELYNTMREEGKTDNFIPVIIIEDEHGIMEQNVKFAEEDYGSINKFKDDCISKYKLLNVDNFFEERKSLYEDDDKFEMQDGDNIFEDGNSIFFGSDVDNVYIAKIPTNKPYEIMAYIPMGGFSDCPENFIHMAIARHWYIKYGALPIAISYDSIQFKVEKPVIYEEDLARLALEQYLYCGNIIWQGVETLNNLKNTLSNSTVWHFWWE